MKKTVIPVVMILFLLFGGTYLAAEDPPPTEKLHYRETVATVTEAMSVYQCDESVTLRVRDGDTVRSLTLPEYLCGVVRGEMLPTFHAEALCAQAVAERTYVYYQLERGAKEAHPDVDFCTDPGCCTAWLSEQSAREKWGDDYDAYETNIAAAVENTDGYVALYQGNPIMAVFHSSSAGTTAASGEVWAADLPYLVSVRSPEGENVPNYYSVQSFSAEEFCRIFCEAYPKADFSGTPDRWVGDIVTTNQRVDTAAVGGVTATGRELRQLYGLRSTAFTVSAEDGNMVFHVTGYGHGVGMSQYGADELARQGKTWQEILAWYYTGITVSRYAGAT